MTNKIAIVYDSISILLNGIKLGVPAYGSYKMSRKSFSALVFPEVERDSIANVTFRNVSTNHIILVRFIKKVGAPSPDTGSTVTFVNVQGDHTIEVTFGYFLKETPTSSGKHTKLLLGFNDNHTVLRPDFYMYPNNVNWDFYTSMDDINSSLFPWFTVNVDYIKCVVDFIKDDSVYNHVVGQVAEFVHGLCDRTIGSRIEQYLLQRICSTERIEGRSSFTNEDNTPISVIVALKDIDVDTNILTKIGHGLLNSTWMYLNSHSEILPGNLYLGGVYQVIYISEDTFKLADGSVEVDITFENLTAENILNGDLTFVPTAISENGYFVNQYLPGCKLGIEDFTIDFWWKFPLIKSCGSDPWWPDGTPYYEGDLSNNAFFILTESNKYNFDGSLNNALKWTHYDWDTAEYTFDPNDDEENSHAVMEYNISAFIQVKPYDEVVIDSGVASGGDTNTLTDPTKSWEIDELCGKWIQIVSGTGSLLVISSVYDWSTKMYLSIEAVPKLIIHNTATSVDIVSCPGKFTVTFQFPMIPDVTSHYEITERFHNYRMVLQHQADTFNLITHKGWSLSNSVGRESGRTQYFYSGIIPYSAIIDTDGQWNHIAFVRFKDVIKCYFNGVALEEEFNIPFKFIENTSENYMMQVKIPMFNGHIDVFRVNDVAVWTENFDPFDPVMTTVMTFDMECSLDSCLQGDDTLLLLHMNGEDESSLFYDSSKYHHTVINNGYSNSSAYIFNNVGVIRFSWYSILVIENFDINIDRTNEFTIDFWIKLGSNPDGKLSGDQLEFVYFGNSQSGGDESVTFSFGHSIHNGIPSIWVSYSKRELRDGVHWFIEPYTSYFDISGVFCSLNLVNINRWVHVAAVWYNSELKFYINGYAIGDAILNPYFYKISKSLDLFVKLDWGGEIDEFRISSRAQWTSNFTPSDTPYPDPKIGYNQVELPFDMDLKFETIFRSPGEYDIVFDLEFDLLMIRNDIKFPTVEFDLMSSLHFMMNTITKHAIFVFGNKWKKELLANEFVNTEVEGNYRVALLNPYFNFDPDTHDYFIGQVDAYEITVQNGYKSNLPLIFKNFSPDGLLSFYDFSFPIASGGSYGPVNSLVIYDYAMDLKGTIVGCLVLSEIIVLNESTIRLSDLSFQIV